MLFLLKACCTGEFSESVYCCNDLCLYVHTVGWIKPNYVSLSVLAAILCGVCRWFVAFSVG